MSSNFTEFGHIYNNRGTRVVPFNGIFRARSGRMVRIRVGGCEGFYRVRQGCQRIANGAPISRRVGGQLRFMKGNI